MIESPFITRTEWNKHIGGNWRSSHGIAEHILTYVPGWGYSQAEIDAFFEGTDGGKKQVHWDRITGKPGTYPPSGHQHAWADVNKAGSNLTDLATRQHAGLTDVTANQHHDEGKVKWDSGTDATYLGSSATGGGLQRAYPISWTWNAGLNKVTIGLLYSTSYFDLDGSDQLRIKLNDRLVNVNADMVDGKHETEIVGTGQIKWDSDKDPTYLGSSATVGGLQRAYPIKWTWNAELNKVTLGLLYSTSYFDLDGTNQLRIKGTTMLPNVNADMVDGKHESEIDGTGKVRIKSGETPGYLGELRSDGVLHAAYPIGWTYSQPLNKITLSLMYSDSYFELDGSDNLRIKLNSMLVNVDADMVDGLHASEIAGTGEVKWDSGTAAGYLGSSATGGLLQRAYPIKWTWNSELNKVTIGLLYSTSYFDLDGSNQLRIKLNTLLTGVDADKVDGYHWDDIPGVPKVAVDAAATADYLGATRADGALQAAYPIGWTDGGDKITLGLMYSTSYFELDGSNNLRIKLNSMLVNVDADKVDGEHASAIVTNARVKAHFPDTIANILSDHNVAVHNALDITELGTVSSGVWQATPIANAYIAGINQDLLTTSNVAFANSTVRRYLQSTNGVPTSNLGSPTVTEMALFDTQFNNKTEFYNINNLKFYTYDAGWTEYTVPSDTDKRRFLGGDISSGIIIPNLTEKFRVEITNSGAYVWLNALYMYWSSNSHNTPVHIWRRDYATQVWSQLTSSATVVSAWPGHMYLPFPYIGFSPTSQYDAIRIEFTPNWSGHPEYGDRDINLYRLQLWGGYPAGRRTIYYVDENKKVTFPGELAIGTINAGVSDYDKFLVSDAGLVKYRTGAQVLSDIGASGTGHTHVKVDITDTPWAWTDVSKTGSNLTDLVTRQHAGLTDVTEDQHHAKVHSLVGAAHSASGLTIGHVIRATGGTSFAWAQLGHGDLGGVGEDTHHNKVHAIGGAHHTGSITLSQHGDLSGDALTRHHWDQITGKPSFPDKKVAVDAAATADYLGAARSDGVLQAAYPIKYTDGGDKVTLGLMYSTSYFELDGSDNLRIKLNSMLVNVDADMVDGLHASEIAGTGQIKWDSDTDPTYLGSSATVGGLQRAYPIKWTWSAVSNKVTIGLLYSTSYFDLDGSNNLRIKLNTLLTGVDADKVDGEHASAIVTDARVKAHFPDTIANILSDHDKATHDALALDHGDLSGKGDDDHTQYILVDGTRAFSGVVSGITPTVAAHLATKGYVDTQVGGVNEFVELTDTPSNYTGSAGKFVKVNATPDALVFATIAWGDVSKTGSNLTDLATRQHAGLTDVTSDQHHNQSHVLSGSDHTASGLTTGNVIRASGATTFAWAQLGHGDLGGVTSDQHHAQSHTLASHSTKPHSALTGVTSGQHHAQLHASEHHVAGGDLVNHDSLTGFVAAEHVSLPNTIANVLSDHNLAAHTALGLFNESSDVDHAGISNVLANQHHAQSHTLASHSTKPHSALTDVTANQHHDEGKVKWDSGTATGYLDSSAVAGLLQRAYPISWTWNAGLNKVTLGLLYSTTYFDLDGSNQLRIKLNTLLTGVDADKVDGYHWNEIPGVPKVAVDAAATADYLGATRSSGALQAAYPIKWTDGGDKVTLGLMYSTSYFDLDGSNNLRIKLTTKLINVNADMVDGKHDTDFAASSHTHVKADITDTPWAWTDVSKTGSNLTDLVTRQHAGLTNVTANQHHDQSHVLSGSDHTASGLTTGNVIRASGATTFAWAQLQHSDLGGVTSDLHHAQSHTLASHSTKAHSELTGVTSDLHHPQSHTLVSHTARDHHNLVGLDHDDHTLYLLASGTRALSGSWDAGSWQIRALKFYSDQATGVAPFTVLSTTKVANLNVDRCDDKHVAEVSTASTIVARNSSGDINARLFKSEYDSTNATCNYIMTQIDTVSNNYLRPSTKAQLIASLNLMTKAGGAFTGAAYASDHGGGTTDMLVNVCYGTGSPPLASSTTIGTLFVKYV